MILLVLHVRGLFLFPVLGRSTTFVRAFVMLMVISVVITVSNTDIFFRGRYIGILKRFTTSKTFPNISTISESIFFLDSGIFKLLATPMFLQPRHSECTSKLAAYSVLIGCILLRV